MNSGWTADKSVINNDLSQVWTLSDPGNHGYRGGDISDSKPIVLRIVSPYRT
jgi:hypothetical protein